VVVVEEGARETEVVMREQHLQEAEAVELQEVLEKTVQQRGSRLVLPMSAQTW
jgi:hypothetical protein